MSKLLFAFAFFCRNIKKLSILTNIKNIFESWSLYDGSNNDIQCIEISGSQYSVDELDLVRWLRVKVSCKDAKTRAPQ